MMKIEKREAWCKLYHIIICCHNFSFKRGGGNIQRGGYVCFLFCFALLIEIKSKWPNYGANFLIGLVPSIRIKYPEDVYFVYPSPITLWMSGL